MAGLPPSEEVHRSGSITGEDEVLRQRKDTQHYRHPAGGWGSVASLARILFDQRPSPAALATLLSQNKAGGHMCTSCAFGKPHNPNTFEFCENGAKATIWDLTSDRCGPDFFEKYSLTALSKWSDHDLEKAGRLTHPMRYDHATDHYVPTTWDAAFVSIGRTLRMIDPEAAVFYTSGRASLETAYLFALFARLYGHNNLPDSSNMCHETTSVALKAQIGTPVGTCTLPDFETCDLILFFGQNTGTNSPRFLHPLQQAVRRGCKVISFNPVREAGLIRFTNPQSPIEMATGSATTIAESHLQVRPGGDIAALTGLCKHILDLDIERGGVIDRTFIESDTQGFDRFTAQMHATSWTDIERESGLPAAVLKSVADLYTRSERVIGVYGMGLTQHVHGSQNVKMLVNLLLLRGNISRAGTGICPVRGHSNVQGQRTVGISEKPDLVPLDRLAAMFGFDPPRKEGRTTVKVAEGMIDGSVRAFLGLGGNFARAIPDVARVDETWSKLDLTVQIATKLNRSHLMPGREAWLLPCIVRAECDEQSSGPQAVSIEDSFSHIHGSLGRRTPAHPMLKSEISIISGIAKATLQPNPNVKWDEWTGDYSLVRDLIEQTYPNWFADFNDRLFTPGGFYRGNPARERTWHTPSGRALFEAPDVLSALGSPLKGAALTMITLRSNDQFNTTIYGFDDRLRGLKGSRDIVLVSPDEMATRGLVAGQLVALETDHDDGVIRRVAGLRVTPYDLPRACVGAYYPEANALVPLDLRDVDANTPAYKGVPVRIVV